MDVAARSTAVPCRPQAHGLQREPGAAPHFGASAPAHSPMGPIGSLSGPNVVQRGIVDSKGAMSALGLGACSSLSPETPIGQNQGLKMFATVGPPLTLTWGPALLAIWSSIGS